MNSYFIRRTNKCQICESQVIFFHDMSNLLSSFYLIKNILINYIFSFFSEMIPDVIKTVQSDFGWDDEYDYDGL